MLSEREARGNHLLCNGVRLSSSWTFTSMVGHLSNSFTISKRPNLTAQWRGFSGKSKYEERGEERNKSKARVYVECTKIHLCRLCR
jgi:hypothetical protein